MKVLLNTTTLRFGGSLQTSTAFILEALRHPGDIDWVFAMSRDGASELAQFGVQPPAEAVIFDEPPTMSLAARRRLLALEAEVQPDCVFTFSGPAYVRFRNFHLLGCSAGWVTHSTWTAYRSLASLRSWTTYAARFGYKWLWFRQADAWVVQTETARRGLARRLRLPLDRITVILNTCGERYLTQQGEQPFPPPGKKVRILCFSVAHKHKNLEILPRMARLLMDKRPELDFQIVVTLPSDNWLSEQVLGSTHRLRVADRFENRGQVPVAQGPDLYRSCDISILPTLLETFSANYPEAMAMGLPIVTTDLDFAHDVCDDAAIYYRPGDPQAAADAIVRLLANRQLWERLVARGKEVLQRFPTPQQRYQQYVRLLLSLDSRQRESAGAPSVSIESAPQ